MNQKPAARITLVVAACAAALAASACWYGRPADQPTLQRFTEPVATGTFVVEPRNYKMFKVVVNDSMTNPRLEGTFSATGARNDIEVTLLDDAQYANWQNRRRFEAAYESGRVTNGTLGIDLPAGPGTWWVVFSNRFSLLSNKAVVADVQLCYDRLQANDSRQRQRGRYRE